MNKVAIFGDVHGQSNLLKKLIEKIYAEEGQIDLYNLGDLIDRGPDSSGVIELCINHNIKGILGNHETYLRHLIQTGQFEVFALAPIMGGKYTLYSYNIYGYNNQNIG